jgi:hypothetical protein
MLPFPRARNGTQPFDQATGTSIPVVMGNVMKPELVEPKIENFHTGFGDSRKSRWVCEQNSAGPYALVR